MKPAMEITPSKAIYVASLIILGILLALTSYRLVTPKVEYSEVQRGQLLEREDETIIQLDIINHEGRDTNYTIKISIDGKNYTDNVLIRKERKFTYVCHVYQPKRVKEVTIAIYKEGEPEPIEEATYQLGG